MVHNHSEFRFMSRRALQTLANYPERNPYLRGMIPLIGFKSTTVDEVILERQTGVSKYTLNKLFNLALDGITSFSTKLLSIMVKAGLIFIIISLAIACYVIYLLFVHIAVPGLASLMLSVWFVGGVILIALEIVGIYIDKIHTVVKHHPLYNIKDLLE